MFSISGEKEDETFTRESTGEKEALPSTEFLDMDVLERIDEIEEAAMAEDEEAAKKKSLLDGNRPRVQVLGRPKQSAKRIDFLEVRVASDLERSKVSPRTSTLLSYHFGASRLPRSNRLGCHVKKSRPSNAFV